MITASQRDRRGNYRSLSPEETREALGNEETFAIWGNDADLVACSENFTRNGISHSRKQTSEGKSYLLVNPPGFPVAEILGA